VKLTHVLFHDDCRYNCTRLECLSAACSTAAQQRSISASHSPPKHITFHL